MTIKAGWCIICRGYRMIDHEHTVDDIARLGLTALALNELDDLRRESAARPRALYPDDLREVKERLYDQIGEANLCKKTLMATEVIALSIMEENRAEGGKPDGRD